MALVGPGCTNLIRHMTQEAVNKVPIGFVNEPYQSGKNLTIASIGVVCASRQ